MPTEFEYYQQERVIKCALAWFDNCDPLKIDLDRFLGQYSMGLDRIPESYMLGISNEIHRRLKKSKEF